MSAEEYRVENDLTNKKVLLPTSNADGRNEVVPRGRWKEVNNSSDVGDQSHTDTGKDVCSDEPGTFSTDQLHISEYDRSILGQFDRQLSPGLSSVGSYGGYDTSSSDEETEVNGDEETEVNGELYDYCNISVLLRILYLHFRKSTSALNALINQFPDEGLGKVRSMLAEGKRDEAITIFLCGKIQTGKRNCFGNPFRRLMIFSNRDKLLDHQRLGLKTATEYDNTIHGMILEKLNDGLQEAINAVLNENGTFPYYPKRILPFIPFDLQDILHESSQLPDTITYHAGVIYRLAGIVYHSHNTGNKKGDNTGDHFVVRAYDPVKTKWLYSSSAEVEDDWEKDEGDPISDQYIYKLSMTLYIISDYPPEDNDIPMTGLQLGKSIVSSKPPEQRDP